MAMLDDVGRDLDAWLTPFLEVMGRKTRRTWAPLYVRGLLGPSERKSLQPMAAQLGLGGHDGWGDRADAGGQRFLRVQGLAAA